MIRDNDKSRGYVAAISLTAVVFLLRLWADGFLGNKVIFLPYFFVIIGAAALGGLWPGLLATLLSTLAGGFFLWKSGPTAPDYSQLVLFSMVGVLISVVGESFHRAKRKLSAQSQDLEAIRKRLESAESSSAMALEAGRMGTWEWQMSTDKVSWTPSMGVVFDLEESDFPRTFKDYLERLHPEDRDQVKTHLEETFRSGSPTFEGRYRINLPGGGTRWIATRGQSVISGSEVVGLRGVCWDISEEVEADISQARLATIVATSDDGIISKDLNGRILTWNSGAEKIFGYSKEEIEGKSIQLLLPEERIGEEADILARIRKGGSVNNLETIRKHKDGRYINVSVTISPIFDANRNVVAVSTFVRDVTTARALERGVIERERRLTLATDTAKLGIMEWNLETGEVRWENDLIYDMFGRSKEAGPYTFEEFLDQAVIAEERDWLRAEVASVSETADSVSFRFQIRRENDGMIRSLHSQGSIIRSGEGKPLKLVAVLSDITDKLTAEEQLNVVLSRIDDHLVSYDSDWRYVYANDGACKAVGLPREEIIGKCIWDLFPEAIGNQYYRELHQALETQKTIRSEHFYEPFNKWFENHIYPSRRGVTVFSSDITNRKQAEMALEGSREQLAAQERQLQHLIDSIPVLISLVDSNGIYRLVNKQYESWFSIPASEIVGHHMIDVLGKEAFEKIEPYVLQALSGSESSYELEVPYKGAGNKFVRANYVPSRDIGGNVDGFFVLVADHTETNQREQDTKFIANASSTLAEMVDYKSTLKKIAELAVPYFADWCSIDIMDEHGNLERLAVAHKDPAKVQLANELHIKYPPDPNRDSGVPHVIRTGKPELVPVITPQIIDASTDDPEIKQIIRDLGLHSYICVPLSVKGKPIGAISFVSAEMKRSYGQTDLANAEDLARRASVSVENALLYQQLQESDRRKDEFLATLAHELRNPLAPLRTGLDILARSAQKPEVVEEVQGVMARQLTQMVRLVDDLLDTSRITTGKLELRKETVSIRDLVEHAVESNRALLEQRNQSLFVNQLNDIPPVTADPARITQVLQNLLNNAAKYTDPGGSIQITIEHAESQVVVTVKDNGIGIDQAHLPGVFGMFSQVESALTRSHGGLGIGLALVKGLVEMHGGSVDVRSEGIGKGSEFIVRLPAMTETKMGVNIDEPKAESGSRRVLVVDDNVDIADMLGKMLSLIGNEVQTSNDGPNAIECCREFRPDVVLLDIGMPGMNGYEVARKLRQEPCGSDIKLIALTGWGSDDDKRQTKEAGFDHHLVKPVQLADLEKIL